MSLPDFILVKDFDDGYWIAKFTMLDQLDQEATTVVYECVEYYHDWVDAENDLKRIRKKFREVK